MRLILLKVFFFEIIKFIDFRIKCRGENNYLLRLGRIRNLFIGLKFFVYMNVFFFWKI